MFGKLGSLGFKAHGSMLRYVGDVGGWTDFGFSFDDVPIIDMVLYFGRSIWR